MTNPDEHTNIGHAAIDTATGKPAPAELSTDRVKSIFSSISRKYERFNAISSFGAYRLWLKRFCELADIEQSDDVLDIAGGTGDVAFCVARTLSPRHIQCTDLVPEMLEVAKDHYAKGASEGVDVTFDVVDAQAIPYGDDSFDAITMAYGIRNMPDRARALQEMLRVLRPGGSITCLDFSTPTNPVWRSLYNFYLKHMIPFWGKLITGDSSGFIYLARSIESFPDQEGVCSLFEEAGFKDVRFTNLTGGIAAIHTAKKPTAEVSRDHTDAQ